MDGNLNMTQFLECSLGASHYLLDCANVREVLPLPALTSLPNASCNVAGLLNLRGKVLEVLNGRKIFGTDSQTYSIKDKVIILDVKGQSFGLIVEGTHHVQSLAQCHIEPIAAVKERSQNAVIASLAHTSRGIIPILDPLTLHDSVVQEVAVNTASGSFFQEVNECDYAEFKRRADRFAIEEKSSGGMTSAYAVIELGGERYGIDLKQVTEFLEVDAITPVPCCPAHIVGNINWHGDVLTVIDIASVLDLPQVEAQHPHRVVVFGQKREALGVIVDNILNVCQLKEADILPAPTTLKATREGYLSGVAEHQQECLGILCMEQIIGQERWSVNETV